MHERVYHVQAKDGFQFLCVDSWFSKVQSYFILNDGQYKLYPSTSAIS